MRKVAFLTDVEGRWEKLTDFCAGTPLVRLHEARGLEVADDALFVFGGDAIDRGPASRRIMATLLDAKTRQPDRVVLLAGNRDINKLRLLRELDGHPPPEAGAPGDARGDLLRAIFALTMGAKGAFDHRRAELEVEGRATTDDAVVDSFLEDVSPGGAIARYLAVAVLGHREDETLFLHGGVTAENLGVVPGRAARVDGVDPWLRALNDFHGGAMEAYLAGRCAADGTPGWQTLIAYQAPLPGTRHNQASVVYARAADDLGEPMLPDDDVVARLASSGVRRVVVGHTPSGDCPALLRHPGGFELLLADNSYGRVEHGSRVTIAPDGIHAEGDTMLDDGARAPAVVVPDDARLGLRDAATGRLLKARLAGGAYLAFRGLPDRRVEQIAISPADVARASLVAPTRASIRTSS